MMSQGETERANKTPVDRLVEELRSEECSAVDLVYFPRDVYEDILWRAGLEDLGLVPEPRGILHTGVQQRIPGFDLLIGLKP